MNSLQAVVALERALQTKPLHLAFRTGRPQKRRQDGADTHVFHVHCCDRVPEGSEGADGLSVSAANLIHAVFLFIFYGV